MKLILLEGIPSSGKTYCARYTATQLRGIHNDVRLFTDEAIVNPVDLSHYAFLTPEQYQSFSEEERSCFNMEELDDPKGFLIPFSNLPDSVSKKLKPYRFYGRQPWDLEKKAILSRWKSFAEKAASEEAIYIFDGYFLKSILNEMIIRFELHRNEIEEFINELGNLIRPLDPLIVYLEVSEIEERIRTVSYEHDFEWLCGLVSFYTGQNFSDDNSAPDLDACALSLETRQAFELKLISQLGLDRVIIQNAYNDWIEAYNYIRSRIYEKTTGKYSTD